MIFWCVMLCCVESASLVSIYPNKQHHTPVEFISKFTTMGISYLLTYLYNNVLVVFTNKLIYQHVCIPSDMYFIASSDQLMSQPVSVRWVIDIYQLILCRIIYHHIVVVVARMPVVAVLVANPAAVGIVIRCQCHCMLAAVDCLLQSSLLVKVFAGSHSYFVVAAVGCCMLRSLKLVHFHPTPCCHSLLTELAVLEVLA